MYCIPRVLSGFELTLVLVPSPLASLGGNQFSMVAWRGVAWIVVVNPHVAKSVVSATQERNKASSGTYLFTYA